MSFWKLETVSVGVSVLKVSRPEALNALNRFVLEELGEILDDIAIQSDLKVLIVTGEGRAFVAGADILDMRDMDEAQAQQFAELGQDVFNRLANLPQLTIAAINGFALGGGMELALACDLRLASSKAKLGQPEITLGIIPGFGATQRLARLIGGARAKELLFTGRMFDAAEALTLGVVNRVVEPDDLLCEAQALAEQVAKHSLVPLRLLKAAVDSGAEQPLEEAFSLEAKKFAGCFTSHDQKEGMTAFLEKRKPDFQNR